MLSDNISMQVYFELRDNKRLATSVSPASSPGCSSQAECELPIPIKPSISLVSV